MVPHLEPLHITCCECAVPVVSSGPGRATLLLPCQHVLHLRCVEYLRRAQQLRMEAASHGLSLRSIFYSHKQFHNAKFSCPGCSVKVKKVIPLYIGDVAHSAMDAHPPDTKDSVGRNGHHESMEEEKAESEDILSDLDGVFQCQQSNLASLRGLINEKVIFHDLTRSCAALHNEQTTLLGELEKLFRVMPQLSALSTPFSSAASSPSSVTVRSSCPLLEKCSAEELQMYLAHTSPVLYETENDLRKIRKRNDQKRKQLEKLALQYRQLLKKRRNLLLPSAKQLSHGVVGEGGENALIPMKQTIAQQMYSARILSNHLDSSAVCLDAVGPSSVVCGLSSSFSSVDEGHDKEIGVGSVKGCRHNISGNAAHEWVGRSRMGNSFSVKENKECDVASAISGAHAPTYSSMNKRRRELAGDEWRDASSRVFPLKKKKKDMCNVDTYFLNLDKGFSSEPSAVTPSTLRDNPILADAYHELHQTTEEDEIDKARRSPQKSLRYDAASWGRLPSVKTTRERGTNCCPSTIILNVDDDDDDDDDDRNEQNGNKKEKNNDEVYVISDSDSRRDEDVEEGSPLDDDYCRQDLSRSGGDLNSSFSHSESLLLPSTSTVPVILSELVQEPNRLDNHLIESREIEEDEGMILDNLFLDGSSCLTRPLRPNNWISERIPNNALQLLPRREDYLWQKELR